MEAARVVETRTFERDGIKAIVEYTEGYQKRFTKAVLEAYRRKVNGEARDIGGRIRAQEAPDGQRDAV